MLVKFICTSNGVWTLRQMPLRQMQLRQMPLRQMQLPTPNSIMQYVIAPNA